MRESKFTMLNFKTTNRTNNEQPDETPPIRFMCIHPLIMIGINGRLHKNDKKRKFLKDSLPI